MIFRRINCIKCMKSIFFIIGFIIFLKFNLKTTFTTESTPIGIESLFKNSENNRLLEIQENVYERRAKRSKNQINSSNTTIYDNSNATKKILGHIRTKIVKYPQYSTNENSSQFNEFSFKNKWREVKGSQNQIYVYSAFYDTRKRPYVIRLIALIKKKTRLTYCILWDENGNENKVLAKIKLIRENWNLLYSCAFITCEIPSDFEKPAYVTPAFTGNYNKEESFEVEIFPEKKAGNLSVCVKAFHYNFDRAVWLVEFVEMYKLLGADHFWFYNHSVGPNIHKVLKYYQDQGVASIMEWNLPVKSQKEVRTEAIFATLNDCNLRSVGRYSLMANVDLDEYLIPHKHNNLISLISSVPASVSHNYYSFQNAFFYLYWNNDTVVYSKIKEVEGSSHTQIIPSNPSSPSNLSDPSFPYLLTAFKTTRLVRIHKHGQRSKYIVRPEKIIELGNHNVYSWVGKRSFKLFSPEEGISHHYRICEFGGYTCLNAPHKKDNRAHHWLIPLYQSVMNSCENIFPKNHTCPPAPPLGSAW